MTSNVTSAQSSPGLSRRERLGRSFLVRLLAIALGLLLFSAVVGGVLRSQSPLALLSGSERIVAGASMYVPARSPLTLSLLASPDRLVSLRQALATDPDSRQRIREDASQLYQSLAATLSLDFEQDVAPWLGEEVTLAYTDEDLDQDVSNGSQPGYLLALEIAPGKLLDAQLFLQRLWQQRSLSGAVIHRQKSQGTTILSMDSDRRRGGQSMTAASVLIGDEYVLFANSAQVLAESLQAAQTGTVLALDRAYRRSLDKLPAERLGLGYVNWTALKTRQLVSQRDDVREKPPLLGQWAIALSLTEQSLIFTAKPDRAVPSAMLSAAKRQMGGPVSALKWLPAGKTQVAVGAKSMPALISWLDRWDQSAVASEAIPEFIRLGNAFSDSTVVTSPWDWAQEDYALGRLGSSASGDWLLAVKRAEDGISTVDAAAAANGYSVVPVDMDGLTATAWTRLTAARSGRSRANTVETSLLGLHLQQGGYELFSNSLSGLQSFATADEMSLVESKAFQAAIAPLGTAALGHVYADWSALSPMAEQIWPPLRTAMAALKPLISHFGAVALTTDGETVKGAVQLSSTRQGTLSGLPRTSRSAPGAAAVPRRAYRPPTGGVLPSPAGRSVSPGFAE